MEEEEERGKLVTQDPRLAKPLTDAEKLKAGAFMGVVTGASVLFGFGVAISRTRKQDPKYFMKGLAHKPGSIETGGNLAARALGLGTLYAVTGVGLLTAAVWFAVGASSLRDFRYRVGQWLPKLSKDGPPESRTEFENLTDLMGYLQEWGKPKEGEASTERRRR